MSKRRGSQHRRSRQRHHDPWSEIGELPPGYLIFDDGDGERLVYDPDLIEMMRAQCPICAEGRGH